MCYVLVAISGIYYPLKMTMLVRLGETVKRKAKRAEALLAEG